MIEVPNITIPNVVSNQHWLNEIPKVPSNHPPITTQIGFPIVEIPKPVTMHKDNQDKITKLPFDKDLQSRDPKGTTTCVLTVNIHHTKRWNIHQSSY